MHRHRAVGRPLIGLCSPIFRMMRSLPFLPGGLNPDNVAEAFAATHVDGADTSSGVENDTGIGKDREKILRFVENVKSQ